MSAAASVSDRIAASLRVAQANIAKLAGQNEALMAMVRGQRSITQEIDSIPGRRIFYSFVGTGNFDSGDNGLRGEPISFLISQDGPFVMTHYPSVSWRPSLPSNADNFGKWSPVATWPTPTQNTTNLDSIDISYEFVDGGSQRNFQNAAVGQVISRPDNLIPLPMPTLFAPNASIQFFPTYNDITFATAPTVDTTQGTLVVSLCGYRIVNL
jgi:hypothetical protein